MRLGISSTLIKTDLETAQQQQCTMHEKKKTLFRKQMLRISIIT